LNLIYRVFVDLRSSGRFGQRQGAYVQDLADAMHNISALLARYDEGFLNDEKFRRIYLRGFDMFWASESGGPINLDRELDEFAATYAELASSDRKDSEV